LSGVGEKMSDKDNDEEDQCKPDKDSETRIIAEKRKRAKKR
jgi:hypothetical protein